MSPRFFPAVAVAALLTQLPSATAADWRSLIEEVTGAVENVQSGTGSSALGSDEIARGLKEALASGVETAIASLGKRDGFLRNALVHIPVPDELTDIESALRALGQGHHADAFVETMNRAAESAVPEAGPILGDAIRAMTIQDARQILDGADDAATTYFRRVSGDRLGTKVRPIVESATSQAGVTSAYKQLVASAGPAAALLGSSVSDVDGYVTDKALDGLFTLIAQQEKRLRDDPLARGSELLKKVFGSRQ